MMRQPYASKPRMPLFAAVKKLFTLILRLQKPGKKAVKKGITTNAIQLVPTTDREAVRELCRMTDYLDLIIPRGGESLINAVIEMALVPVIKHYKGICHTYIDSSADLKMAWAIAENAKCQRPGVCNAMETLLVHKDIAAEYLPKMGAIFNKQNVTILGDSVCCQQIPSARLPVKRTGMRNT